MRRYSSVFLTLLGLGLAVLLAAPARTADNVDPERIGKLIKQLGSAEFAEREKASKELDAIGTPALEPLQKALKSDDAEVRLRAEDLVKKIEKRLQSEKILTPTRIRLVYKDTPVKEAVEDFAGKTKFNIVLVDPQNKLAGRKVTLDTGETTFWEALDKFCQQAGLVVSDGTQPILVPEIQPQPQPLPRVRPPRIRQPLPVPQTQRVDPSEAQEDQGALAAPVQLGQPGVPVAPAVPVGAIIGRPVMIPPPIVNNGQIMLMDGTPESLPTCYAGSVRIRALRPLNPGPANCW